MQHTPLNSPGIYIRTLIPDGPAAADGRLCIGDRILAVNGTSLIGADYQRFGLYIGFYTISTMTFSPGNEKCVPLTLAFESRCVCLSQCCGSDSSGWRTAPVSCRQIRSRSIREDQCLFLLRERGCECDPLPKRNTRRTASPSSRDWRTSTHDWTSQRRQLSISALYSTALVPVQNDS